MSNAPYALPQARSGYRMGNGKMIDVMIHDGLWDPYGDMHMGNCAELCATKYKFTREEQDEFARESYRRAQDAIRRRQVQERDRRRRGRREEGQVRRSSTTRSRSRRRSTRWASLQAGVPEGRRHGHRRERVEDQRRRGGARGPRPSTRQKNGLKPLARIVAQATAAQEPEWFTTAPAKAIDIALQAREHDRRRHRSLRDQRGLRRRWPWRR